MLPTVGDWLTASWADYRRRWASLMGVIGIGSVATLAAAAAPVLVAGLATVAGAGPVWAIWLAAWFVILLAGLWLSTWAQAAAVRVAAKDERTGDALRSAWGQTAAFAWVLSLAMLAAGGGFVLFILPGLVLSVLLFFAPFYQIAGEDRGMGALELSYARVKPAFAAVSGRLALVAVMTMIASKIPYLGWLLGALLAPFALVAYSRLANDLKAAFPEPARPSLGGAVGALSFVFVAGMLAAGYAATKAAAALQEEYASGRLQAKAPDAETMQAIMAMVQGTGTPEDRKRSLDYALSLSSATAP